MPFALFNLLKKEFGRFNRIICSSNYLLLEFFLLFIQKNYIVLHTPKKMTLIFFYRNY